MIDQVKSGIDHLETSRQFLEHKRLALITNATGINKYFKSTIDILNEHYELTMLFAPEHGVRGDKQAAEIVTSYTDERTGLPVISLYGKQKEIPEEVIDAYDILVYDIQDIGSRHYTYLSSLLLCMKSCAKHSKQFVVLDRPNPIGGQKVEGNKLKREMRSFVGCYEMPQRYALTIGEFAKMANETENLQCDLKVIPMENYKRSMYYNETGLPFVMPSPNIPTQETQVLYNGTCLFEGTTLSEGRGTTKPFEVIGAPWINSNVLADKMNEKELKGVYFRPTYFTPTFSKHQGKLCGGVQIHILSQKEVEAVKVGLYLIDETRKMTQGTEFFEPFFDSLAGITRKTFQSLQIEEILETWEKEANVFTQVKKKYHLYA